MENPSSSYIAKTGASAKERLALQHKVFSPGTQMLLEMAGFKPEMRVLVVGCGCGDETIMLANQLNDKGEIVAIDISNDQLTEAKRAAELQGVDNKISFLQKSVYDLDVQDGKFDLILCRFVIPHFEDPHKAIKILKNRLCENGTLATQEPLVSTCKSEPPSPALAQYINLMMDFGKATHRDFDMAKHLPNIFKACDLKVTMQTWQPQVLGKDKQMVSMSALECMPAICKLGLFPNEEADNLIKSIEDEVVNREDVILLQCENVLLIGQN